MKKTFFLLLLTFFICSVLSALADDGIVPVVKNSSFEEGTTGWTVTGKDLRRLGQSSNYLMRSQDTYAFDAHQSFKGTKRGLYRLRCQTFQVLGDADVAWSLYGRAAVDARLYLNAFDREVKNIFDDACQENIYKSGDFLTTTETTFVPFNANSASVAFTNGLYDTDLYAYVDADTLTIGVKKGESSYYQWTCFDNFRLEYISEQDLAAIADSVALFLSQPLYGQYKTVLTTLQTELNVAADYAAKSQVLVKYSPSFADIRQSKSNYQALTAAIDHIKTLLQQSPSSPAAKDEALDRIAAIRTQLAQSSITNKECPFLLAELQSIAQRLSYNHLSFVISTPGSLNDSILSKCEFAELQSLTLSGTLNEADLNVLKTYLTALRDLDLSGVKLETLPNKAFYQNKTLQRIVLPRTLVSIGENVFYECPSLRSVTFGPKLETIGYNAFRCCPSLEDILLPTSLRTIDEAAFRGCSSLKHLVLPEGLTTMGNGAFLDCASLAEVTLPSTLTTIPSYAFQSCNLYKINFAEGLTTIGTGAFKPTTGTETSCDDITRRFYNNTLENVKFPSSLRVIGDDAFYQNKGLVNIDFNEGLFQLGTDAFGRCEALEEVTLPSSLVLIFSTPFSYCDKLVKLTSLALDPPFLKNQLYYSVKMDGRALYVPALSINNYKVTSGWDQFPTILPIDYMPENISVLGDLRLTLPETIPAGYHPNISLIRDKKDTYYWNYGSLTVNGPGTLFIEQYTMSYDPYMQYDDASRSKNYCSLINNSSLQSDNVAIETYTPNNRWVFLSFPFDVKVSDIETFENGTTNWIIRRYDGQRRAAGETATTWVKLNGNDVLQAHQGYILQSSRYVGTSSQYYSAFRMKAVNNAKKNTIFQTTDITVPLQEYQSEFTHNRSWNLIGNPYPSYFDTRFMDYQAPITIWNMNRNNYEAYSPVDDSYVLCPGEAFFVQCPVGATGILFRKDGRQTTREVRAPEVSEARRIVSSSPRSIVNLVLSNNASSDRTRIVLNEKATMQYEMNADAAKFLPTDPAIPQIYSTYGNTSYAINERPLSNGTATIAFRAGVNGLYRISLANDVEGYQLVLEDKLMACKVALTVESPYEFSADAGTHADRFVLHFLSEETGISEFSVSEESDNTPIYTLEGIKVSSPKKGVYVKGGKKVMLNK
jgi:hypothetical protein